MLCTLYKNIEYIQYGNYQMISFYDISNLYTHIYEWKIQWKLLLYKPSLNRKQWEYYISIFYKLSIISQLFISRQIFNFGLYNWIEQDTVNIKKYYNDSLYKDINLYSGHQHRERIILDTYYYDDSNIPYIPSNELEIIDEILQFSQIQEYINISDNTNIYLEDIISQLFTIPYYTLKKIIREYDNLWYLKQINDINISSDAKYSLSLSTVDETDIDTIKNKYKRNNTNNNEILLKSKWKIIRSRFIMYISKPYIGMDMYYDTIKKKIPIGISLSFLRLLNKYIPIHYVRIHPHFALYLCIQYHRYQIQYDNILNTSRIYKDKCYLTFFDLQNYTKNYYKKDIIKNIQFNLQYEKDILIISKLPSQPIYILYEKDIYEKQILQLLLSQNKRKLLNKKDELIEWSTYLHNIQIDKITDIWDTKLLNNINSINYKNTIDYMQYICSQHIYGRCYRQYTCWLYSQWKRYCIVWGTNRYGDTNNINDNNDTVNTDITDNTNNKNDTMNIDTIDNANNKNDTVNIDTTNNANNKNDTVNIDTANNVNNKNNTVNTDTTDNNTEIILSTINNKNIIINQLLSLVALTLYKNTLREICRKEKYIKDLYETIDKSIDMLGYTKEICVLDFIEFFLTMRYYIDNNIILLSTKIQLEIITTIRLGINIQQEEGNTIQGFCILLQQQCLKPDDIESSKRITILITTTNIEIVKNVYNTINKQCNKISQSTYVIQQISIFSILLNKQKGGNLIEIEDRIQRLSQKKQIYIQVQNEQEILSKIINYPKIQEIIVSMRNENINKNILYYPPILPENIQHRQLLQYKIPRYIVVGRPLNNKVYQKSQFFGYDDTNVTVEDLAIQYYKNMNQYIEDNWILKKCIIPKWEIHHVENKILLTLYNILFIGVHDDINKQYLNTLPLWHTLQQYEKQTVSCTIYNTNNITAFQRRQMLLLYCENIDQYIYRQFHTDDDKSLECNCICHNNLLIDTIENKITLSEIIRVGYIQKVQLVTATGNMYSNTFSLQVLQNVAECLGKLALIRVCLHI